MYRLDLGLIKMFGLTASLCSFSMARLDQKCCLDRGTGPSRCDGWTTLESPSSSVAVVLSPPSPSHLHLRSPADDSESPLGLFLSSPGVTRETQRAEVGLSTPAVMELRLHWVSGSHLPGLHSCAELIGIRARSNPPELSFPSALEEA